MSSRPRPFIRMLIACFFFISAVILNILLPRYWHNIPEIVKHLLLVFSAIMCVHIMEYAYLWWEIFGHIRSILQETLQATHQLIDDNRNSLEKSLQTSNQLFGMASTCGLTNIYSSRKDVKGDIYNALESAEKRVWLQGIALSENVHLDEFLPMLSEKKAAGIDVKILLHDALHDSAVFRILLESTAYETVKIINTKRTSSQSTDLFFHQKRYSDFIHVCDRLQSYPNVGATVRFYTHAPSCWVMIADNTAHFQPETFGQSPSKHPSNLCIDAHMPVFKFQMQPKGTPFERLEDHFLKLWLTSNMDLFHIEARIADRNRIIKNIFDSQSSWFKHIFEVLHAPKGNMPFTIDRRKFPRQPWEWNQTSLNVCSEDCKPIANATIYDYSCEGISLKTEGTLPLSEGQLVTLQGTSPKEQPSANFIVDHFLGKKRFMVRRIANGPLPMIGLQSVPEGEIHSELTELN